MKILAFAASNSRNSINRMLLDYAIARLRDFLPEAEVETLDLNDYEMPIYSIDREHEDGIPTRAREFFDRIKASDAVLVSFAEHNGFTTAAWKNIFDWMSRIETKLWQGKPLLMLAASPGPRAGAGVLSSQEKLAPHFGADLRGSLGIGKWSDAWNADTAQLNLREDIDVLDAMLLRLIEPPAGAPEA